MTDKDKTVGIGAGWATPEEAEAVRRLRDKTVGGRTREEWERSFSSFFTVGPTVRALLDAAFDSRGIRDGLERAAEIVEGAGFHSHDNSVLARQVVNAIRAEASKLDGAGSHACGDANCIVPHPPAGKTEPPAAERKLTMAHPFINNPAQVDSCLYWRNGRTCGRPRSTHEPA